MGIRTHASINHNSHEEVQDTYTSTQGKSETTIKQTGHKTLLHEKYQYQLLSQPNHVKTIPNR